MKRRTFLRATAGTAGLGLAGCLTRSDEGSATTTTDETTTGTDTTDSGTDADTTETATTTATPDLSGTLKVATYQPFVDSPSSSPGPWIKERFEEEYPDATVEWVVPEGELNTFIQRRQQGVDIGADIYVGLNVDDLVKVDSELGDRRLFQAMPRDRVTRANRLRSSLEFGDPRDRVLPYDTGYISLVYDKNEIDPPATFEDLTTSAYEGTLLAQNAQSSDPGQAFLLWTISTLGEDSYLDYWERLADNDVRITSNWWDSYKAYLDGERPMVVSYSTDQVYANRQDQDMSRHQIGFIEDQGYANPEGMAIFDGSDQTDLAVAFVDFLLGNETQATLATRNVQFPAVEDQYVDLPEEYAKYAHRPPEPVAYTYEQLQGNLGNWVEQWARTIASK